MMGLAITVATFTLVYLRAIQQLNVIHHHYKMAAITSYLIAAAEVSSMLLVVQKGWPAVPFVGTGGAFGVTLAMYTHKRLRAIAAKEKNA